MPFNSASRRRVAFACIVGAALAAAGLASSANAQADRRPGGTWTAAGTGDCTGRDWGQSDGALPQPARCLPNTSGQIAVCWDGVRHKHPGKAGAWCTYKSVTASQCSGGSAPGVVYQCSATAAAAPPPAATPPPAPPPGPPPLTGAVGWVPRGFDDCTGSDWASSEGLQVDASKCTPQTLSRVAVCWDGVALKHPSRAGAWCTYKTAPLERCAGGSNKGYMHECRNDLAAAPPPPAPSPAPPPAAPPAASAPPSSPPAPPSSNTSGQAGSKTYPVPMYGVFSVSNCINFGSVGCGQGAADQFCRMEGFLRATTFKIGYGAPMPWVPAAGRGCDDPGCARLENVTCAR